MSKSTLRDLTMTDDQTVSVLVDCGNGLFARVILAVDNGAPRVDIRDVPREIASNARVYLNGEVVR